MQIVKNTTILFDPEWISSYLETEIETGVVR